MIHIPHHFSSSSIFVLIGLHLGLLWRLTSGSGGEFHLGQAKLQMGPQFPSHLCCPSSNATSTSCPPKMCQLVLKVCLGVYFGKTPVHQELLKCSIGQGEIILPLTGQPLGLEMPNSGVKMIKVQGRWQSNVNIIFKLFHRERLGQGYKDILIRQTSLPDPHLKPGKSWTTRTVIESAMDFSVNAAYRFKCNTGLYGDECDRTCTPRDGAHGHYDCSDTGEMVCHRGWKGSFCNEAKCESGCANGKCISPNKCVCHSGWNGTACDKCIPYPGCVHGGCGKRVQLLPQLLPSNETSRNVSSEVETPLTCVCHPGWAGMFCNVDLRYCEHNPNVCGPAGKCVNSGTGNNLQYTCICNRGFTGTHCERQVPSCHLLGCRNNGTCPANSEECVCPAGYSGNQCQFSQVISCKDKPCQGANSSCEDIAVATSNASVARYRCVCEEGRHGANCQHELHECDRTPKLCNSGKCVSVPDGVRCVCPVGLSGQFCQLDVNDCRELSCQNGAVCTDLVNSVTCQCREGFEGVTCGENVDECARATKRNQILCHNGGQCIDTYGSFRCQCTESFNGRFCEKNVSLTTTTTEGLIPKCPPGFCQNGGICEERQIFSKDNTKETRWGHFCRCQNGYSGENCQNIAMADKGTILSILSLASIFILISLFLILTFLALVVWLLRRYYCVPQLTQKMDATNRRNNTSIDELTTGTGLGGGLMLNKLSGTNLYTLDSSQADLDVGKTLVFSPSSSLLLNNPHGKESTPKAASSLLLRAACQPGESMAALFAASQQNQQHGEHTYSELDYPLFARSDRRYENFHNASPASSRATSLRNLVEDPYGSTFGAKLRSSSSLSQSQQNASPACFCATFEPLPNQASLPRGPPLLSSRASSRHDLNNPPRSQPMLASSVIYQQHQQKNPTHVQLAYPQQSPSPSPLTAKPRLPESGNYDGGASTPTSKVSPPSSPSPSESQSPHLPSSAAAPLLLKKSGSSSRLVTKV